MTYIDYNSLFTTCVYLCSYSSSKTISPRMVQCAFRILYGTNPLSRLATTNGAEYILLYASAEKHKISDCKKAPKLLKILKEFLDTVGQDLYSCNYRISALVPIYLCALDDTFDNTYKTQLDSLRNRTKSKKEDDMDVVDDDLDEDVAMDEDVVDNNMDEEVKINPTRAKSTRAKSVKTKSNSV